MPRCPPRRAGLGAGSPGSAGERQSQHRAPRAPRWRCGLGRRQRSCAFLVVVVGGGDGPGDGCRRLAVRAEGGSHRERDGYGGDGSSRVEAPELKHPRMEARDARLGVGAVKFLDHVDTR